MIKLDVPIPPSVNFTINGTLPNLNDYTTQNRRNKFAGAKMKNQAESLIIKCVKAQLGNTHFVTPVSMHYKWYEPSRRRDKDNVAFAKKFIQDALVKCGVLNGDGWDYITSFSDEFEVDKKNPRIEVTIQEATNGEKD